MAVLLALTYLGIIVVFWFLERKLVFHPNSAAESWLKPEDARSEDVSFTAGDGNTISARWISPESPRHGAVLVAHGNGGNLTHRGKLAADLRKALAEQVAKQTAETIATLHLSECEYLSHRPRSRR